MDLEMAYFKVPAKLLSVLWTCGSAGGEGNVAAQAADVIGKGLKWAALVGVVYGVCLCFRYLCSR